MIGQNVDDKISEVFRATGAYGLALHINGGEFIQYIDVKSGRALPDDVLREQVMLYLMIMGQDLRSCALRRLMVLLYEDLMDPESIDHENLGEASKKFIEHMKGMNGFIQKVSDGTGKWTPKPVTPESEWNNLKEVNDFLKGLDNGTEGKGDEGEEEEEG